MEPSSSKEAQDTFTAKTNAIRTELRSRMRALKLRGITNGQTLAANHNLEAAPLTLSEDQDPMGTVWPPLMGPDSKDIYVGNDALLIPDPHLFHYAIRWPLLAGHLNQNPSAGYRTKAEILADIEAVWLYALSTHLGIKEQDLKEYSAILILPDIYDHVYLREMVDLLFRALGFKQICLQQESLCACFGAGLGSACVVDIGATTTSVSCVEEGWVLPDTRIQLPIGGDDITIVLAGMLRRQNFPYKDLNLNCTWEWQMMEQLKEDMLVLSEADILFSPSIIEYDRKLNTIKRLYADKEDVDDVLDLGGNPITEAMRNSTGMSVFTKSSGTAGILGAANGSDPSRLTVAPAEETASGTGEEGASPYNHSTPQPNTLGVESSAPTPRPSPGLPATKQVPNTTTTAAAASEPAITPSAAFLAAVSKIPLHEATVHSILACGNEERAKRMAGAIMIVGGGALIHNVGYALTSRIQPILAAKYPTIEATTIPPPRDLDPRILAWKGVSLICRIESASDLWIRSSDWEVLGSKAIKDRTIFMC
ncbi:hypothetical protein VP01_703g4 [Puccinia sorghi]|uniref:Uncharacterized protein n=1 Tax=Puccinia sorghi TaxID=27349 RepID=A0A0L6UFW6_9BASI|nr:hypothetical protein VP01_703g4 [Puccinia sorghi]